MRRIRLCHIRYLFNNCTSLSVNLSNLNSDDLNNNNYLFNNSKQLSVNLSNWNVINFSNNDYKFSNIYGNFTYCINDKKTIMTLLNELNSLSNAKRDCSSKCYPTPHRLNILTNQCDITNCGQNDTKIYEYNNLCYEICPKKTNISSEDEYICEDLYCDI